MPLKLLHSAAQPAILSALPCCAAALASFPSSIPGNSASAGASCRCIDQRSLGLLGKKAICTLERTALGNAAAVVATESLHHGSTTTLPLSFFSGPSLRSSGGCARDIMATSVTPASSASTPPATPPSDASALDPWSLPPALALGETTTGQGLLGDEEIRAVRGEIEEKASIILGSSSSSRQGILQQMGVPFAVMKAGIDEKAIRHDDPFNLVVDLSRAKADALLEKIRELEAPQDGAAASEGGRGPARMTILITSDQVVVHGGRILEKPETADEAREFISGYSRSVAGTVGATMVTNLSTGFQAVAVDTTQTFFSDIPESHISQLIEEGVVFYCAGALMVEHPLVAPQVTGMVGTSDAVMGLPVQTTWSLLRRALRSQSD